MGKLAVLVAVVVGCVQPQPSGGYYPQPQYQQQPPPQYGQQQQPEYAGEEGYAPPQPAPYGQDGRRFSFNGHPATPGDLQILAQIEQMYRTQAPAGDYWYDPASGAAGRWGGPTLGFLPAGMALGGPMPANASGGGDGRLTGVFINGRELHPVDVQVMMKMFGQVLPGRWWVDAQGNFGAEGGPPLGNLVAAARQRGGGADSYYKSDGTGNNVFVGGGCVSVSSTAGGSSSSYYSAGC